MAKPSARLVFLRAFGAIYVIAFVSFWLQYDGLLSDVGLLPARLYWRKVRQSVLGRRRSGGDLPAAEMWAGFRRVPSVAWVFDADGGDAVGSFFDSEVKGLTLVGATAATLASTGLCVNACVFLVAFLAYLTLVSIGQTWLAFQWDLLILETGAAAVLYAGPFGLLTDDDDDDASHPAAWVLRAIFLKFMLMSGIAKVEARCPTWESLTALEYHFASTCLPTAPAWLFHSLPPFILRFGVAVMFVVELVAPWLVVAPLTTLRRVGVVAQLPLQAGIALTGNYNWFNLHTVVLLLPAWARDSSLVEHFWDRAMNDNGKKTGLTKWGVRLAVVYGLGRALFTLFPAQRLRVPRGSSSDSIGSIATSFVRDVARQDGWAMTANHATPRFVADVLDGAARRAWFLYFSFATTSVAYVARPAYHVNTEPSLRFRRKRGVVRTLLSFLFRVALVTLCACYLTFALRPLERLVKETTASVGTKIDFPFVASPTLEAALEPFRVSNSYGLFRRMTGVGNRVGDQENSGHPILQGWAGADAPSVVAVPVVTVETSVDGGTEWREVPFRYYPGDPKRRPRRTAPHQPRLDWQLWFAALGSYHHNPWFLHLMFKIVDDDPDASPVLALLLDDFSGPEKLRRALPYNNKGNSSERTTHSHQKKRLPKPLVRASRYEYDLTRAPTPWAMAIPGAALVAKNCSGVKNVFPSTWLLDDVDLPKNGDGTVSVAPCDAYWTRRRVADYVPAVDRDALVEQVLKPQGRWPPPVFSSSADDDAKNTAVARKKIPPLALLARRFDAAVRGPLLRRFGGFALLFPLPGAFSEEGVFLDGPLLVIAAALALPYLLVVLLAALGAQLKITLASRRRVRRRGADARRKQKSQ